MFEVTSMLNNVIERWWQIGQALGISDPDLRQIIVRFNTDIESCIRDMLRMWLNQSYNTEKHRKPSWQRLSEAVRHRCGGNNPALADEILQKGKESF